MWAAAAAVALAATNRSVAGSGAALLRASLAVTSLPQGRTFQLLRLRLDSAIGVIPEISANRLLVSVRMMRHESDDRLHPFADDAQFELTLCA